QVIGYEQVEAAIVVIIEPPAGDGPGAAPDAGLLCDIFEFAVAQVAVEMVGSYACNEQVHMSVVVEISRRDAMTIAFARQTGIGSHILEFHAAQIVEEPVVVFGRAL